MWYEESLVGNHRGCTSQSFSEIYGPELSTYSGGPREELELFDKSILLFVAARIIDVVLAIKDASLCYGRRLGGDGNELSSNRCTLSYSLLSNRREAKAVV